MKEIFRIFAVITFIWLCVFIPLNTNKEKIVESSDKVKENITKLFTTSTKQVEMTSNDIKFDMDLRDPVSYTAADYNKALAGTPLQGLGQAFKDCEKTEVSSLFMAALACHESGYGSSALSRNKNNLFGFMAYDKDPYNSAKQFSSKEECIKYVSKYLKTNYLTGNGQMFNGYNLSAVNKKYASDKAWADKVFNIMQDLQKKMM
ncbi:MAG: glucosaminidase domain-containing protein [Clostridia bacterium]